jgi:coenzyme F420 hydrogenase subunit beta
MAKNQVNNLVSKAFSKKWSPDKTQKYIGSQKYSYFCYSTNLAFREMAASGGTTTALLADLLQTKMIEGALVCKSVVNDAGRPRPEFFIATSESDLLSAQGSKYCSVFFSSKALPLIREFAKTVAVVALPCDTKILREAMRSDPVLQNLIVLIITPFCGHNSEPALTDHIIEKLRPGENQLVDFRYRTGHWRGELKATFEDNIIIQKPFSYFSIYQNLYFFSQKKCHHCYDHTGYYSDLSVGDIWSYRMKDNPIKHNSLIVRTERANKIVSDAFSNNVLAGQKESIEAICEGQARSMPTHYNISARAKLGWIVHEKIKDPIKEKPRFTELIVAAMILINARLSRSSFGQKLIFSTPKPILQIYLYFFKFIESL